ncbi:MAG: hypothetical protein K6G00_11030 [Treponema sp.]|nr:hypothetical protein [Treponema sp.]
MVDSVIKKIEEKLNEICENRRLILNQIIESCKDAPSEKREAALAALGDFGKKDDSDAHIESFFKEEFPKLLEKLTVFLSAGDPRLHDCLWELGEATLVGIKAGLLEKGREDVCNQLGNFVFTFDDISKLDDRDIQKILREIDTDYLKKALLISTEEVKEKFFNNMSMRASNTLKDELKYMKNIPREKSFDARKKILNVMLRLVQCGEIDLPVFIDERINQPDFIGGEIWNDLY